MPNYYTIFDFFELFGDYSVYVWLLFFSFIIALWANKKNRDPLKWAAIALLISPLLAGIILFFMKDLEEREESILFKKVPSKRGGKSKPKKGTARKGLGREVRFAFDEEFQNKELIAFLVITCFCIGVILMAIFSTMRPQWCTDSDEGRDIWVKGIVRYTGGGSLADYCEGENRIREYYCEDGRPLGELALCPAGYICLDGRCISEKQKALIVQPTTNEKERVTEEKNDLNVVLITPYYAAGPFTYQDLQKGVFKHSTQIVLYFKVANSGQEPILVSVDIMKKLKADNLLEFEPKVFTTGTSINKAGYDYLFLKPGDEEKIFITNSTDLDFQNVFQLNKFTGSVAFIAKKTDGTTEKHVVAVSFAQKEIEKPKVEIKSVSLYGKRSEWSDNIYPEINIELKNVGVAPIPIRSFSVSHVIKYSLVAQDNNEAVLEDEYSWSYYDGKEYTEETLLYPSEKETVTINPFKALENESTKDYIINIKIVQGMWDNNIEICVAQVKAHLEMMKGK